MGWLLDLVPPDYRRYDVLRKHPLLLARFADGHLAANLDAARAGWRTLRRDLSAELSPEVIEAAMQAYEREGLRLAEAQRGVAVIRAALGGDVWVPRL